MNRSFILGIALLATASAWSQVPATFFGMTMNRVPNEERMWPDGPIGAIRLWDTGTSWHALNPAPGVYEWSKLDEWFRVATKHNVDILYTFGRTPDWASSNPQVQCSYGPGQCASPKDPRAWDDFVRAIAIHSAGRIKYWEVWNEANRPESWTGSIPQLLDMAKRAKAIIRAIDPNAVVLTPSGTGKDGPEWLARYLGAGAGDSADVVAFHGYCGTDPENISVLLEKYKQVVTAQGLNKPLWDTEASWGKSEKLPGREDRAAFLTIAYLLHLSKGIERFYWYAWDNAEWGMLTRGTELEPAGSALRQIAGVMQSSLLEKPCARNSEGVWSCTFLTNKKEKLMVTWSPRQQMVPTPDGYTQASDVAGKQIPFTKTVTLTSSPIFLLKQERQPLAEIKH